MAAIDEGLDTEDISGIWDVIEAQFRIPKWMERIYQWARHPFFRYPFVNLVLRPKLSLSVELSTGYLNASKRFAHDFTHLPIHCITDTVIVNTEP